MNRVYACIDLKSFYASVECVERGLDPLTTNLVVADNTRTEKTICLAVTPSLKKYGLSGRSRLFEVVSKVKEINKERKRKVYKFKGKSFNELELNENEHLELDYIIASPRMSYYIKYSTKIYDVYLKYIDKSDIFVYSIDEVFMDITNYLKLYNKAPIELITMIIQDVYETTGITATGGIGTNLYLAKIAMDIEAKHINPNEFGVRVAYLDEYEYRKKLWNHTPLTDFWRVGRGYQKRLENLKLYTMGDIARMSLQNEDLLYKVFGVNAEILIDHAWGYEPCMIKDIKNYKPESNSISSGQVLLKPYSFDDTKVVLREMIDTLCLDLVYKKLITDKLVLTIGYDIDNLTNENIKNKYRGEITFDYYGRVVPKSAHGTTTINHKTSSSKTITEYVLKLYDNIVNPNLLIRRINISAINVVNENKKDKIIEQFDLFTNTSDIENLRKKERLDEKSENIIQKALIDIKQKYGKNSILKGTDYLKCATGKSRNNQIGGHKA